MRLLIFILVALLPVTALAKETNLLINGDFENGRARWTASGGSFTLDTATPLSGKASGLWDASALNQTLQTTLRPVPVGFAGRKCQVEIPKVLYSSGADGDYALEVLDQSSAVLVTVSVPVTSTNTRTIFQAFDCPPSTDQMRLSLRAAVANPGAIEIDDAFLGQGRNEIQVSQSELTAFAFFPGTANCVWTNNAPTFQEFPVDVDCPAISVVSSSQPVDATDTNLPQIVFPNLLPGKYTVEVQVPLSMTLAEVHTKYIRISDGTTNGPVCMNTHNSATGANEIVWITCSATFTYTTSGARTFRIQASENGTGSITIDNQTNQETRFEVRRDPLAPALATTLETSGWFFDGNIGGGANAAINNTTTSTYTTISNASLDLVLRTGSQSGQIACDGANAATGLTCSSGNEQIGVVVSLPQAGYYEACFDFTYVVAINSGQSQATFQVARTADASLTILEEGGARVTSGATGSSQTFNLPNKVCGTFNIASAGRHAFRLAYEQNIVSGTTGTALVSTDRDVANGQRDVRVTVRPLTQNMPAPVFAEINTIKDSAARSNANFQRIERARISCSGSSSITSQSGSWINSIGNISNGECVISLNASRWSSAPTCNVTVETGGAGSGSRLFTGWSTSITTSSMTPFCASDTGAPCTSFGATIICVGPGNF